MTRYQQLMTENEVLRAGVAELRAQMAVVNNLITLMESNMIQPMISNIQPIANPQNRFGDDQSRVPETSSHGSFIRKNVMMKKKAQATNLGDSDKGPHKESKDNIQTGKVK